MINKLMYAVCLLMSVALLGFSDSMKSYRGDQVFRVFPNYLKHVQLLRNLERDSSVETFDFWSHIRDDYEPVDIRIASRLVPSFRRLLEIDDMPFTVVVSDVQELFDSVEAQNAAAKSSRNSGRVASIIRTYAAFSDIVNWAQSMCSQHSTIATCSSLGTSYENRTLLYMKLGKAKVGGKQNAIFIEAGAHAREYISPASTVYIIDKLISNYNTDPTAKRIIDSFNIYVAFVINPDGYEYSRKTDRYWRKTRSRQPDNCFGVDFNRNFDIAWSTAGSSISSCSETYHGSKAFSEKETTAIADFVTQHADELLAYFAIHSFSQMWLIPYGYQSGAKPSDYSELLRVANIGGDALMAVNKQKWQIGNTADILYLSAGTSADWVNAVAGVKYAYTLELRPAAGSMNGWFVPETEIAPSGEELYAGIVAAIDAMAAPS